MQRTQSCIDALNVAIPDSLVSSDLKQLFRGSNQKIEYDDVTIVVPDDCIFEIFQKACIEERFGIGFGCGVVFRVDVAIGGVKEIVNGVVKSDYGFAVLWYSNKLELVTTDFHRKFVS